jgi:pimeloyl-ACP methyl ester carboxylesterase
MSFDSLDASHNRLLTSNDATAADTAPANGSTNGLQEAWFKLLKPMLNPSEPAAKPGSGTYEKMNLTVDGQQREFEVYRSAHFDPTKPARVIVGLHGDIFGKDAASGLMAKETGFDQAIDSRADADNTLLVYPIANNRTASMISGQSWNYANHKNIFDTWTNYDDGKYMDQVLAQLKQHVKIKELDGVGFGDGGRFLKQYSDEHPGLFKKVVLDNATTLGDTPSNRVVGTNTDYLIMHAIRDPAKSSFIDRVLHPFTTNLMLPYDGGPGFLAKITPNASGLGASHPDMQKVEAARQTGALPPVVIDTPRETDTIYASSGGGSVTERLEKSAQMAWNDTHNGDGGHGIFALFGARSDFDDTKDTLDFIFDGKTKFVNNDNKGK